MVSDSQPRGQVGRHPLWFNVLLLLDAGTLGGLVVWKLVLDVLHGAATRVTSSDAIGTFFHIDDLLVTYWLGHTFVAVLLAWVTAGAYLWLRTRLRLVPAMTLIIPLVLAGWLLVSRR